METVPLSYISLSCFAVKPNFIKLTEKVLFVD